MLSVKQVRKLVDRIKAEEQYPAYAGVMFFYYGDGCSFIRGRNYSKI